MVAEVFAGLGAFKTALDIAKGLKDIDDATRRNAAVIELQEKILAAQEAQSALIEKVRELEKEVTELKAWVLRRKNTSLKTSGEVRSPMFVRKMLNRPNHRIGCVHNATKTARNLYCNTIMVITAIMFMTAQHAEEKFGWTILLAQAALRARTHNPCCRQTTCMWCDAPEVQALKTRQYRVSTVP